MFLQHVNTTKTELSLQGKKGTATDHAFVGEHSLNEAPATGFELPYDNNAIKLEKDAYLEDRYMESGNDAFTKFSASPPHKRQRSLTPSTASSRKRRATIVSVSLSNSVIPQKTGPRRYSAIQESWFRNHIETLYSEKKDWPNIAAAFNQRFGQDRSAGALSVKWQLWLNANSGIPGTAIQEGQTTPPKWTKETNLWMLRYGYKNFEAGKPRDYKAMAEDFEIQFGDKFSEAVMMHRYIQVIEQAEHERRVSKEEAAAKAFDSMPSTGMIANDPGRKKYNIAQCQWLLHNVPATQQNWKELARMYTKNFQHIRTQNSLSKKWKELKAKESDALSGSRNRTVESFGKKPRPKDNH